MSTDELLDRLEASAADVIGGSRMAAEDFANEAEAVRVLVAVVRSATQSRVEISVVHDYPCPLWRLGKRHGPCNCEGDEQQKAVDDAAAALHALAAGRTA